MDFAALIPVWLDAILIAPYRWPASPYLGMWIGSGFLAAYCLIVGELFSAALFLLHHRYYNTMQDKMVHYHNLSVQALHAGDKQAYLAANKLAQEDFGKSFFAQATIGFASLWPVPFALGWMSARFEGLVVFTIPVFELKAGYVCVLLSLYIALRILFSLYIKNHLPVFRRIAAIKREAREARGKARSFFLPDPPADHPDTPDANTGDNIPPNSRVR
jgi:hypothetical protein